MVHSGSDTQNRIRNDLCSRSCPKMATAAATSEITTATSTEFHPKIDSSPALMITVSTTLNPTNVNNVPIRGSSTPRYPNCARD